MESSGSRWKFLIVFLLIFSSMTGCGIFSRSEIEPLKDSDPTPTPTDQGGLVVTDNPTTNPCQGLTGTLKLEILVGPSEAVGLEPITLGNIPFSVNQEGESYTVDGGGPLEFYSDVLSAEWGTFTVTFEGNITISGECVSSGDDAELQLQIEMVGDQNVEIVYDGTRMNYPWSGSNQISATLPVADGATEVGEGWLLTLYLN